MPMLRYAILVSVMLVSAAFADSGDEKRARILQYFEYVGLVSSIELQVETVYVDFENAYSYLPREFWSDNRVRELFNQYKVDLLRSYVEVMEAELDDKELEFLVQFYSSEEGRRVVEISQRVDAHFVAAGADAGRAFNDQFAGLAESYER